MEQGDVGRVMVVAITDGRANVSLARSTAEPGTDIEAMPKPSQTEIKDEILEVSARLGAAGLQMLVRAPAAAVGCAVAARSDGPRGGSSVGAPAAPRGPSPACGGRGGGNTTRRAASAVLRLLLPLVAFLASGAAGNMCRKPRRRLWSRGTCGAERRGW